jgi:uncharacterized protein involved in high-affinity Fe2+ transport
MKIRNLMVLIMTALAITAFVGCGKAQQQAAAPVANTVSPDEAAGFEEFPLGDDHELGPLNVAGVYFQPVDMIPSSMGLPASQSDIHIEADISALENELGYGVGDFVPNLTVRYEISQDSGWKIDGTFMPMNASDGPHYGANVKLNGVGDYNVKFFITNPEAQGYVLHVDKTTGVPGRFWSTPLVAEWDVNYPGPAW